MKNLLVQDLMNNGSKKQFFDNDVVSYSYRTGNAILDYAIGYVINVYDENDNVTMSYPSLGISAGSQVMCIGKSSTGKTTWAVGVAAAITRGLPNAFTMHFDLEQAQNFTRIKNITGFKMSEIEKEKKYILKQGSYSISDIKAAIMQIYVAKTDNPDQYKYDTGKLDEFGKPIIIYEPTVVIIDSIPSLATDVNLNDKKDRLKFEEVSSQPDRMRLTGEISRFYNEIGPYLKEANIILISINQIKARPQGFIPSPAELMYLNMDESMPGGKTPPYLANVLLKFISIGSEKFTNEDDGLEGFGSNIRVIKSRTNTNGKDVHVVYNKLSGFSSLRSCILYAKDNGMLGGNKSNYYFNGKPEWKDYKFGWKTCEDDFKRNRELYSIMYDAITPSLRKELYDMSDEDALPEEEFNY